MLAAIPRANRVSWARETTPPQVWAKASHPPAPRLIMRPLPNRPRRPLQTTSALQDVLPMPVAMELSRIIISEINNEQVIFLKEIDGARTFPILIGMFEAQSIDR